MPTASSVPHVPLLTCLGEYGHLDTNAAHEMVYPNLTRRRVQQILRAHRKSGHVVTSQLLVAYDGSCATTKLNLKRVPALHGITDKAGDLVEQATGNRPPRICRSTLAPQTLDHRWQCIKVRLAFDACAASAGLVDPEWIHESDVRSDVKKGTPANQCSKLYHRFEDGDRTFACCPDMACRIVLPVMPPSDLAIHFEHDNGSEGSPQLRRKARGLQAIYSEQRYRRYWPSLVSPTHRIFWIVGSEQRAATIMKAAHEYPVAGLFRFLLEAQRDSTQLLTDSVWIRIANDGSIVRRRIMPPHDDT